MAKWLLTISMAIMALVSFAQSDYPITALSDTNTYKLTLKTGTEITGRILEIRRNEFVAVMKTDSTVMRINWETLDKYERLYPDSETNTPKVIPPPAPNLLSNEARQRRDSIQAIKYLTKHRNVGKGLAFTGLGMFVAGTAMLIAGSAKIKTYNTSNSAGVSFSGSAAGGIVLDIAAIPFIIVGCVKISKANKHIYRYKTDERYRRTF